MGPCCDPSEVLRLKFWNSKGTMAVAQYKEAMEHASKLIKSAKRKYYTFLIGKINCAKLNNFMEVDMYVLVACNENSLIDSKDLNKPCITLYELEVALNHGRTWGSEFICDYNDLLPGLLTFKNTYARDYSNSNSIWASRHEAFCAIGSFRPRDRRVADHWRYKKPQHRRQPRKSDKTRDDETRWRPVSVALFGRWRIFDQPYVDWFRAKTGWDAGDQGCWRQKRNCIVVFTRNGIGSVKLECHE